MIRFFQEIFAYHHHYNQAIVDIIQKNELKIPDKVFSLFSHILNAHQIWNSRILGATSYEVWQSHALDTYKEIDERNFSDTLTILKKESLEKAVTYKNFKGDGFSNSIRDILFQIANHTTHHRGQIILLFRQSEIEPPITDYIFYLRK